MLWVASGFGAISDPLEFHRKLEGSAAADLAERVSTDRAAWLPPSAFSVEW